MEPRGTHLRAWSPKQWSAGPGGTGSSPPADRQVSSSGLVSLWGVGPMGPELKVRAPATDAQLWGCTCDNPSFPFFGARTMSADLCRGAAGVLRSQEHKCGKPPSGNFLCHILSCQACPARASPYQADSERGSQVLGLRMRGE